MSHVPSSSLRLMSTVYRKILPQVDEELFEWKKKAANIPNNELRTQALNSLNNKRFHCLGGAVFSLLAGDKWKEAIRFIVAYQTISDYLDNLCDRSTSLDPTDFRCLHEAMKDVFTFRKEERNYYEYRVDQDDGNYLNELVQTCQQVLQQIENYSIIFEKLIELEEMYADLQVHKHVKVSERVPRLTSWFEKNKHKTPTLTWYEFSAATGSTLGIFCIISYALAGKMTKELAEEIYHSYFPYVQGLHILLDYFIDQEEDREEGDLNFCSYYENDEKMKERFVYFIRKADEKVRGLPNPAFHKMIHHGLVGLYLGDNKVKELQGGEDVAKELLQSSGRTAKFFNWNTRMYNRLNRKDEVG